MAGDEVDHSLPCSVKVRNECLLPLRLCMDGGNFTFFYLYHCLSNQCTVIDICRFLHINYKHKMF